MMVEPDELLVTMTREELRRLVAEATRPVTQAQERLEQAVAALNGLRPLMTQGEVATLLSVGKRTVGRLAMTGELPSVRVRGQRRWRQADVEAYLERLTHEEGGER